MQGTLSKADHATVTVKSLSAVEAQQALPIRVRQTSASVNGVPTNVVYQDFDDQTLILVSQTGKLGCLSSVRMVQRPSHYLHRSAFDTEPIFDRTADDEASTMIGAGRGEVASASLLEQCHQQRLFGTFPTGQRALYELYCAHIARRSQRAYATREGIDPMTSLSAKPVVVGLALVRQKRAVQTSGDFVESSDEENADLDALANEERQRFNDILSLVDQSVAS